MNFKLRVSTILTNIKAHVCVTSLRIQHPLKNLPPDKTTITIQLLSQCPHSDASSSAVTCYSYRLSVIRSGLPGGRYRDM